MGTVNHSKLADGAIDYAYASDVVIIASLEATIPPADEFSLPKGRFKTTEVIKGADGKKKIITKDERIDGIYYLNYLNSIQAEEK